MTSDAFELPEPIFVRVLGEWRTPAWTSGPWHVVSTVEPAQVSDRCWIIVHDSGLAALDNDPDLEEPKLAINTMRVAMAGAQVYASHGYNPSHRLPTPPRLMQAVADAMVQEHKRSEGQAEEKTT